jgi:hypothetical protein
MKMGVTTPPLTPELSAADINTVLRMKAHHISPSQCCFCIGVQIHPGGEAFKKIHHFHEERRAYSEKYPWLNHKGKKSSIDIQYLDGGNRTGEKRRFSASPRLIPAYP